MEQNVTNTLILAGCYLALFVLGELLYHICQVKVEITRKFVHIGTGLLALLFPLMLDDHWWVLFLCTSFAMLLICSLRFDLLKSINAIDRKSIGSLAYPIAVYGCYLAYNYHHQYIFYYLPIMILAISDPLAALSGKKWPLGAYRISGANKTWMGSVVFFVSAFLITLISWRYLYGSDNMDMTKVLSFVFIAFLACIAEAVSRDGYDNVTIPFTVIVGMFMTQSWIIG